MLEINRFRKLYICVIGVAALLLALPAYAAPFAYITNMNQFLTVVDTATNTVVDTVDGVHGGDVVVHPDGSRVYVAGSGEIQVLDTVSNTVTATVPVTGVARVAIDPMGRYLYAVSGSSLLFIDAKSYAITATVSLGSEVLGEFAVHPAGRYIYIRQGGVSSKVLVFDTVTNSVIATVTAGSGGHGILVHPNGSYVYVPKNYGIHVIDTASNTVTATVYLPAGGERDMAIRPDGAYIYVANGLSDVSVVDTATNAVVDTLNVESLVHQMALTVHPDGGYVYTVGYSLGGTGVTSKVSVIDITAGIIEVDEVVVAPGVSNIPVDIAIGPSLVNVGGSVTGIAPSQVECYNMTTGQAVTSPLQGERSWDCEAAGLVVSPSDIINMSVTGTAD